ncbi:MAG: hypothetical protein ACHBN1_13835 [Heteroscytonema crispum UTEX LB 1556]
MMRELLYANYIIRQKFFFSGEYTDHYQVQKLCQETPNYGCIPAKVSHITISIIVPSFNREQLMAAQTEAEE